MVRHPKVTFLGKSLSWKSQKPEINNSYWLLILGFGPVLALKGLFFSLDFESLPDNLGTSEIGLSQNGLSKKCPKSRFSFEKRKKRVFHHFSKVFRDFGVKRLSQNGLSKIFEFSEISSLSEKVVKNGEKLENMYGKNAEVLKNNWKKGFWEDPCFENWLKMKIRNPDWLLILERFLYFWLLIDEKRDCLGLVILEVLTRRVSKRLLS